jgi:glutathione S-transferase
MLEVHHLNNSRSQRILWLMEELKTPYTIVPYQRDPTTMLAPPELKQIHPLGKSPVIRDDGQVIAETGAIIEYLVDKYGKGKLAPPAQAPTYGAYRYFMHYSEGSLMPQLLLKLYLGRVGEPATALLQRVEGAIRMHLAYVESAIKSADSLVGPELTAADVHMSFPLELAAKQGFVGGYPKIAALLGRWHARPAYQTALEKGGPYAYADAK